MIEKPYNEVVMYYISRSLLAKVSWSVVHYCYTAELKTLCFVICSAEDLFTLSGNKFRMVYRVDGNPQLDTCDWSMYSNILKT